MCQEDRVLYYFGLTRTWHLLCLMSKNKPGPVMRVSCLCWPAVIKFILWQVYEEDCKPFLHSLKVRVQTSFALPVLVDRFLNTGHSLLQRNLNRIHPLGLMRKRNTGKPFGVFYRLQTFSIDRGH